MKKLCLSVFLLVLLIVGGAYGSDVSTSLTAPVESMPLQIEPVSQELSEVSTKPAPVNVASLKSPDAGVLKTEENARNEEEGQEIADQTESPKASKAGIADDSDALDELESEYVPEEGEEQPAETISDPLESFNRAMYHFNDKLYFWLLKPVSQAYGKAVPEPARISVRNFFSNLAFPVRFLSCLLQADFSGAAKEAGRFTVNTVWGIGGLMDPSSDRELNIPEQDVDLGQTLGIYGAGHGFYLVWPVFGPSSLRDSVDIVGGFFLHPVDYLNPWYTPVAVRSYEVVNDTSLSIGDYESLKQAAIDPYFSIRDAFVQSRIKKISARKEKLEQPQSMNMSPQQQSGKD